MSVIADAFRGQPYVWPGTLEVVAVVALAVFFGLVLGTLLFFSREE